MAKQKNTKKETHKLLTAYQRFINGRKVVVMAISPDAANKAFNLLEEQSNGKRNR